MMINKHLSMGKAWNGSTGLKDWLYIPMYNAYILFIKFYRILVTVNMPDLKFEIKSFCGVLSESGKGWTKELNLVSWNDNEPKFDLREWNPGHERMGKGITLSNDELKKLKELLDSMNL